jgi:glycosyltransferase involved in cell wall biosynthesis
MNILVDGRDITAVGGVSRFVAQLADAMTQRGHRVFVFSSAPVDAVPCFPLNQAVSVVPYLRSGQARHISVLREQILACEPDVLLSTVTGNKPLLWLAALRGTDVPLIYSEQMNPWSIENVQWNREERRAVLCAVDRVHLFFEQYRASVPEAARANVRCIPNALDIAAKAERPSGALKGRRVLLSLGRLVRNKQNSLLLRAFVLLQKEFPDWRLDIWGDGKAEAKALAAEIWLLGLQGRVRLCGPTTEPQKCYASADIFCLPSKYEGMPYAVMEAMYQGLPVVGFAACTPLDELMQNGATGFLAPEMTVKSLAAALRPLMADADLRREIGEQARKSVEKFAPEPVFDAWEALFAETAACKGFTRLRDCLRSTETASTFAPHCRNLWALLEREDVLLTNDRCKRWRRRFAYLLRKFSDGAGRLLSAAGYRFLYTWRRAQNKEILF